QVMLNRALVLVLVVAFAGQFAFGLLQSTFALYGEAVLFQGYSEESADVGIGLLLAAVGVAQFFTQVVLLPQALRRTGEATLVIVGTLLRSLGFFIFAVITSPWLGVFGSLAFAGGMGLMMPPLQALATHTVADELRGGVLGLYQSAVGLSIIFSTAVAGSIFAVDPVAPYWLGLVLSFVALLPTGLLWRWAAQGRLQPERVAV
ncbi:MAG: MFS transporter, partial [Chloroflexi bacterium]|nr:MFS transporter [Chloroflexota bacterium]